MLLQDGRGQTWLAGNLNAESLTSMLSLISGWIILFCLHKLKHPGNGVAKNLCFGKGGEVTESLVIQSDTGFFLFAINFKRGIDSP